MPLQQTHHVHISSAPVVALLARGIAAPQQAQHESVCVAAPASSFHSLNAGCQPHWLPLLTITSSSAASPQADDTSLLHAVPS